jgi:hypothetical protein
LDDDHALPVYGEAAHDRAKGDFCQKVMVERDAAYRSVA